MKLQALSAAAALYLMYILFNTSRRPPSEQRSYWVLQPEPNAGAQPGSPSPFMSQAQAYNRCEERNDFYTRGQRSSPSSEQPIMSAFTSRSASCSSFYFKALQKSIQSGSSSILLFLLPLLLLLFLLLFLLLLLQLHHILQI